MSGRLERRSCGCRARLGVCILTVLLAAANGCVKSKFTVHVNPDGSGLLAVSRVFDRDAVERIDAQRAKMQTESVNDTAMAAIDRMAEGTASAEPVFQMIAQLTKLLVAVRAQQGEAKAKNAGDPFFDEKELRGEAKAYGAGIKFVSARRLDVDGGRGFVAVYSFKDINDVFIPFDGRLKSVVRFESILSGVTMEDADAGEDDEDDAGRRGGRGIEFNFQTGTVCRLKILLPTVDPDSEGDDDAEAGGDDGEDDEDKDVPEAVKDAREWLSGYGPEYSPDYDRNYRGPYWASYAMRGAPVVLGMDVVCNGRVVGGTASHTNATNRNRIVLLDVDTTRRPPKKGGGERDGRGDDLYDFYDFDRSMRAVLKEPGAVVETNREVVVEFR